MPKFTVVRRVDAFVDYLAEVEAETPEQAAELAAENEAQYEWAVDETVQFDDKIFVTLDADGNELPETAIGDFVDDEELEEVA